MDIVVPIVGLLVVLFAGVIMFSGEGDRSALPPAEDSVTKKKDYREQAIKEFEDLKSYAKKYLETVQERQEEYVEGQTASVTISAALKGPLAETLTETFTFEPSTFERKRNFDPDTDWWSASRLRSHLPKEYDMNDLVVHWTEVNSADKNMELFIEGFLRQYRQDTTLTIDGKTVRCAEIRYIDVKRGQD